MTDAEKELVKAALENLKKDVVESLLPQFIAAEEEKLPDGYKMIVKMIADPLVPQLVAYLDAQIDAVKAGI